MFLFASAVEGVSRAPVLPEVVVRPQERAPPLPTDDGSRSYPGASPRPVTGYTAPLADGGTLFAAQIERHRDAAELSRASEARLAELRLRDTDVRRHERSHAAAAGAYGGAPVFRLVRGPDGRFYAVGGEVGIDVRATGDPANTIRKMEAVIRAALAPTNPSPQDRMVAAKARMIKARAEAELRAQKAQQEADAAKRREERAAATALDVPSAAERTRAHQALRAAQALSEPGGTERSILV